MAPVDETFDRLPNGPGRAMVVQSDGRIVIGGDFFGLQAAGGALSAHSCLARLNVNGTVDATFAPQIGGQPLPGGGGHAPAASARARSATDGAIVVGGSFASLQPGSLTVIFSRNNLLRLTSNGTLARASIPIPSAWSSRFSRTWTTCW